MPHPLALQVVSPSCFTWTFSFGHWKSALALVLTRAGDTTFEQEVPTTRTNPRNLGFLRCLHGRARWMWRIGCWGGAEHQLERLLHLDPEDTLGAAAELAAVKARQTWEQHRVIARVA